MITFENPVGAHPDEPKNKPLHIRACFPSKTRHSLTARRDRRTDETEF